jgi:hypothetical protein
MLKAGLVHDAFKSIADVQITSPLRGEVKKRREGMLD